MDKESAFTRREKGRLISQALFTALSNGYVSGFAKGEIYHGGLKNVCVPGLNCYSCPGALFSCPIGALQAVLGGRAYHFSLYVAGLLAAFGAVFGRFICGWMCPFGLFQDLLHKIPFVKKMKKLPGEKALRKLKYVMLFVLVIALPLMIRDLAGNGAPWFCKYVCPSGTLMGSLPLMISNPYLRSAAGFLFSWKVMLLICIAALSILVYRPFCRYLCPLGAIYGFFNPVSIYRMSIDDDMCTQCGKCQEACGLDIPIYEKPSSMECIRCGKCVDACPHGAISAGFSVRGSAVCQKEQ